MTRPWPKYESGPFAGNSRELILPTSGARHISALDGFMGVTLRHRATMSGETRAVISI